MAKRERKGFSMVKMVMTLLILGVLGAMGGFVYFGWQGADLSGVSGREGIAKGQSSIGYVDIERKVRNALNADVEVTLTEAELNQYIAKNVKMKQGGFMKDFATVKGVYVDLKPDVMEIFIEREVAQYGDEGVIKTDVFKPFTHTVSMKLKIFTVVDDQGVTTRKVEFPGGTIGKAPTPGLMVTIVKSSFDQLAEHFKTETDLGYEKMTSITVGDGFIKLDPRVKTRMVTE
ncbi:MAG: hypothetical protein ACSHX6_15245 [Akkermansiaceae bacterium]